MYLGEHRNDQRDGPGIMFYSDGTQVGGFWENTYINTPINDFKFENLLATLEEQPSQRMIDLLANKISLVDLKKQFSTVNILQKTLLLIPTQNSQKNISLQLFNCLISNTSWTLKFLLYEVEFKTKVILFFLQLTVKKHCYPIMDRLRKLYVPIGKSKINLTAIDKWKILKQNSFK